MQPGFENSSVVTFHKISPGAISPMHADKSALGSMPAAAHQFCEALRAASSFGWYIFPPCDIRLRWDGAQAFFDAGDEWLPLTSVVDPELSSYWDEHCPEDMKGGAPPYLSTLFVPGVVQIWSGLLVSTAPDWSVLVRPLANLVQSRAYSCYEGIVEADWFKPMPLFINIRLSATDTVIEIPRGRPLFQLQPVHRASYTTAMSSFVEHEGLQPREGNSGGMSPDDWAGLGSTIRSVSPSRPHDVGRYGAEVRKRAKRIVGSD
ncbi:DUF6065 family protein [Polaromonas sp.]|uniref:DUF6065 family protein n=1 Tax=Polaromonas sp. TaxID=1869339 RepID=UPI002FC58177